MKFFVKIFGCQYNEWDATRLSFLLKGAGLSESTEKEAEIVYLMNCSVRKTGVDRALSMAKNYLASGQKVIVTGCILEPDQKRFKEKGVVIWDGKDLDKIKGLFNGFRNIHLDSKFQIPNSSLIPIMTGCNNFCSYCAVPYTRGREISRPMEEILSDAKHAVESGEKEIVLLGQNVNSYNQDNDKEGFAVLLEQINAIPGDFTVKFTSNHPKDMTDDIIEAVANLPKIVKEIHLPLQSGSNKILKAMNRPYTKEQYLALINKIKARIPEIKITTDSIVGFPGENEEDFQETVEVYRKVGFAQAFNNKYSPREGTAAWKLGDPISWAEKQRRWRLLNDISYKKR